jgi:predicted nucleotidyltransferase
MTFSEKEKKEIADEIAARLRGEPEVSRIVIFGSFLKSASPQDVDVAVFQTSRLPYWPLAVKYRQRLASVAARIPLDVIPVRPEPEESPLLSEILAGEVVYEK